MQYDPQAEGILRYEVVMRDLLDADSFALYCAGADLHAQPFYSQTLRAANTLGNTSQ